MLVRVAWRVKWSEAPVRSARVVSSADRAPSRRVHMEVRKLDHIALYMRDRDAAAEFLTSHLGFHVVDRTDRYTLVGAGGRIGKLTLFDAPEGAEPSPGVIEHINVRVADPESAAARLPKGAGVEARDG